MVNMSWNIEATGSLPEWVQWLPERERIGVVRVIEDYPNDCARLYYDDDTVRAVSGAVITKLIHDHRPPDPFIEAFTAIALILHDNDKQRRRRP